ncbi:hypothetical protein [Methylobacterium sp. 10]|uniref:hypothetical protein n=1 Tax=Methylobacterium sp. 10 TaxID=1101191 RepID=UPI0006852D51|nr:hypothetical protein [Methylobacterium sp. 10]
MEGKVFAVLLWFGWLSPAQAREDPPGLAWGLVSWGLVSEVPRPSMVDREANVTALIYFHGSALAAGADTDRGILEVCKDEGLQQVISLSRSLSDAEPPGRYDTIEREGVRRHGRPRRDDVTGDALWPSAQVFLTVRQAAPEERRLSMMSRGPRYASCSVAHEAATGYPAADHGARLLGPGRP